MKTLPDPTEALPLIESAEGYLALGLPDLAEAEIRKAIEEFGESPAALTIKQQIAFTRGDYDTVGQLIRANLGQSSYPVNDLHAASISTDPHWVYARCLDFEQHCASDDLYWYNRACFACRTGRLRDAFISLQRGVCQSSAYHAMAFVDDNLEPLWKWILSISLDDEIAGLLVHSVWDQVLANQAASTCEIKLSLQMKPAVPERFRAYLVLDGTMIKASQSMPAGIFREYLEWQKTVALLRTDALADARSRANTRLIERQPRFALRQLKQGNPTAARYHLLHYLAYRPSEFARFGYLKPLGLGYVIEDIAPAIEEDGHFVNAMESLVRTFRTAKSPAELLESVGIVGKTTILFQTRLAGYEIRNGRAEDGMRRLLGVLHRWPHDALCYSLLVDAFIQLGRWEEARLCFRAAPAHYSRFYRCREQWTQIRDETPDGVEPSLPIAWFAGQRDLGGLLVPPLQSDVGEGD